MKLEKLIKDLEKLKEKHGNIDVIVDYDENGWYDSVSVEALDHYDDDGDLECKFINIVSSNEM